jgi:hypothetical protein
MQICSIIFIWVPTLLCANPKNLPAGRQDLGAKKSYKSTQSYLSAFPIIKLKKYSPQYPKNSIILISKINRYGITHGR